MLNQPTRETLSVTSCATFVAVALARRYRIAPGKT